MAEKKRSKKLAKKKVGKKKDGSKTRMKKVARLQPAAKKKVAKKLAKRRKSLRDWREAHLRAESRDLWRFTFVASCIHGDAAEATKAADAAVDAFRERFVQPFLRRTKARLGAAGALIG